VALGTDLGTNGFCEVFGGRILDSREVGVIMTVYDACARESRW
jgi:hypothetical protein